jgi:alcohol dehydrogenase, propanol-preferring
MAVQYAKATGLHVLAVDVTDEKLALAERLGADTNAATQDAVCRQGSARRHAGRARRACHAVSRAAFGQALGVLHKRGTMSLVGLPPGSFDLPIFDVVLNAKTVRSSIVRTREDLEGALSLPAKARCARTSAPTVSRTSRPSSAP